MWMQRPPCNGQMEILGASILQSLQAATWNSRQATTHDAGSLLHLRLNAGNLQLSKECQGGCSVVQAVRKITEVKFCVLVGTHASMRRLKYLC